MFKDLIEDQCGKAFGWAVTVRVLMSPHRHALQLWTSGHPELPCWGYRQILEGPREECGMIEKVLGTKMLYASSRSCKDHVMVATFFFFLMKVVIRRGTSHRYGAHSCLHSFLHFWLHSLALELHPGPHSFLFYFFFWFLNNLMNDWFYAFKTQTNRALFFLPNLDCLLG